MPTFTTIRMLLIYNIYFFTEKKCVFHIKRFLSDQRTVDLTQLSSIIFSCFCFFRKGLAYLRLQFSWTNILHLACYFSLVPYGNSSIVNEVIRTIYFFIKRFYTQKKNNKKSMQANIRLKHSNKKNLIYILCTLCFL